MKRNKRSTMALFCVLAFIAVLAVPALCFAVEVTVSGTVGEGGILAGDDGTEYSIVDNDQGTALMGEVGGKVKVLGDVEEKEGEKLITVREFSRAE